MRLVTFVPEVVRLGFFDYVGEIRALRYKLLFPDLKSPTSSSPMGDRLSRARVDRDPCRRREDDRAYCQY